MHIRAIGCCNWWIAEDDFEKEMVLVVRITIRRIKFTASNRPRIERKGSRLCNLWCVRAAGNGFEWEAFAIDFWNERFFFLPFPPPLSRFYTNDAFNQARMSLDVSMWRFDVLVDSKLLFKIYRGKYVVFSEDCFRV